MSKIDNAKIYYNVRRAQAKIVKYRVFENGELFEFLQRKNFDEYARKLADFYFHNSKDLEIYNLIIDLYKIFLVIAPILQRLQYSFKLDWNRGHYVSFLRNNLNRRVNRKYVRVRQLERKLEPEKLLNNFLNLGVKDRPFLDFAVDSFKKNYGLPVARGKLANCIFDPIFFLNDREGFELRRGNEFVRLEKKKFPGALDIDREEIIIWDYKIRRITEKKTGKTTLRIEINPEDIKKFKEEIKNILKSRPSIERRILLIYNKCNSFIEKHRYTKDAFDQLLDLKHWLKNRVSKIAATDKRILFAVSNLLEDWDKRRYDKMIFKKPNFFWTPEEVKEKNYRYYFSPYREG